MFPAPPRVEISGGLWVGNGAGRAPTSAAAASGINELPMTTVAGTSVPTVRLGINFPAGAATVAA